MFFFIAYKNEKQKNTLWRAISFVFLAIAYLFFIIQRLVPNVLFLAIMFETLAMVFMYLGVVAKASVLHLICSIDRKKCEAGPDVDVTRDKESNKLLYYVNISALSLTLIFFFISFFVNAFSYLTVLQILSVFALVGIVWTKLLLIKRSNDWKKKLKKTFLSTFAFSMLLLGVICFIFYRLPESDIVFFRLLTLSYSIVWKFGVLFTGLAFFAMILEAWNFIRHRQYFRTYVVFLLIAMIVSALGSLIFIILVFNVVEKDNLLLVTHAADSENLLIDDRSKTALFVADLIAHEDYVLNNVKKGDYQSIEERMTLYVDNADLDILRIYNKFGEIFVSPTDVRDVGRVITNDNLLSFAITKKTQLVTFDTEDGVLAPVLVARAIQPLILDGELLGAVEVGYRFDNAFVDYSKSMNNLDVTIYTGSKRSATTITTLDNVSRWIGSEETDLEVLDLVLGQGIETSKITDRLGNTYYSAFKPVRNINGEVIGMIAVGKIANDLLESTRQRLIITFMINFLISFLVTGIGFTVLYRVMSSENKKNKKLVSKNFKRFIDLIKKFILYLKSQFKKAFKYIRKTHKKLWLKLKRFFSKIKILLTRKNEK